MNQLFSDIIEIVGFAVLSVVNNQPIPSELIDPLKNADATLMDSLYPPDRTFAACRESSPLVFADSYQMENLVVRKFITPSLFKPRALFEPIYRSLPENHTIHGAVYRPRDRAGRDGRVALLFLHGLSERGFRLENRFLFPNLSRCAPELDIYAIHQPWHMARTPAMTPYSGSFFLDNSPVGIVESFRQAVSDASQMVSALHERYEHVVVMGVSLGGHVVSYLATCDDRADAYVLCQAGLSLPSVEYLTRLIPPLEERIQSPEDADIFYRVISLERFKPVIEGERVITVHGVYDRLISQEQARELIQYFNAKHPIFYRGGHLSIMLQSGSISKVIVKHLRQILDG
jgi:pimeloyl-ACP methyl ester carboxylesterase